MTAGLLFPKVRDDKPTLREERKATRKAIEANARAVEEAVRTRDGLTCRVPGCRAPGECAHWKPKGIGGDHGERTNTANCFRCCPVHHRGPRGSIHSADLEVIPLTPAGCDGPLAFHWRRSGQTLVEKR